MYRYIRLYLYSVDFEQFSSVIKIYFLDKFIKNL